MKRSPPGRAVSKVRCKAAMQQRCNLDAWRVINRPRSHQIPPSAVPKRVWSCPAATAATRIAPNPPPPCPPTSWAASYQYLKTMHRPVRAFNSVEMKETLPDVLALRPEWLCGFSSLRVEPAALHPVAAGPGVVGSHHRPELRPAEAAPAKLRGDGQPSRGEPDPLADLQPEGADGLRGRGRAGLTDPGEGHIQHGRGCLLGAPRSTGPTTKYPVGIGADGGRVMCTAVPGRGRAVPSGSVRRCRPGRPP